MHAEGSRAGSHAHLSTPPLELLSRTARRFVRHVVCAGVSLSFLVACSHHAKLVTPDTSPASAYECSVDAVCRPASILDDARLNQSGTAFVVLPKECRGHFQQIVILDADSDRPTVVATCAAPEQTGVSTVSTDPAEATDGVIGEM